LDVACARYRVSVSVESGVDGRRVELEGSFNFRDLGGYKAADGRTVRWRQLFRSDGLHRLTGADLDQLVGLGLRTVIDLRTAEEVSERGRIEWPAPDLAYHHLPMLDVLPNRDEYPSWVDAEFLADRYVGMLGEGTKAVTGALAILTKPSAYPAVFHCAAGKDRTGILAAVVLGLLGVADNDIVADYALSRAAMVRMLEWLRITYPDAMEKLDQVSTALMMADPETMAMFLARFRKEYGSFETYAGSLGLAGSLRDLRDSLLE
jgi:protein-tyrosine phosphatase